MAAQPFRAVADLPAPLTVAETIEKFKVSPLTVDAAVKVLSKKAVARAHSKPRRVEPARRTSTDKTAAKGSKSSTGRRRK